MNLKKHVLGFGALVLTTACVAGGLVGRAANVETVNAAAVAENKIVYVHDLSTWTSDEARIFAWNWGSGVDGSWSTELKAVEGTNKLYSFEINAKATDMNLVRYNPAADSIPGWDNSTIWNRYDNIKLKTDENLLILENANNGIKVTTGKYNPGEELPGPIVKGLMSGTDVYLSNYLVEPGKNPNDKNITKLTDNNAKVAAYVFNSKEENAFAEFTESATYTGLNILQVKLPQNSNGADVKWEKMIIVRIKEGCDINWTNLIDQTFDIELTDDVKNALAFTYHFDSPNEGTKKMYAGIQSTDLFATVETYGKNFLTLTSDCDPTGVKNNATAHWDALKAEYDSLTKEAKSLIKHANGVDEETASQLENALARYDFIINKPAYKDLNDFIGRRPLPAAANVWTNGVSYTTLIVIVCSVALTSIAVIALFAIKRKKAAK